MFGNDRPQIFISVEKLSVNVHVTVEISPRPETPTDIEEELGDIEDQLRDISMTNANLEREVGEQETAVASVVTLVTNMAAEIRSLKEDPAALEALANRLDASQAVLANLVIANTDSTETPLPEPEPEPVEEAPVEVPPAE